MKIKISADSTCDLSPELIERYHIGITPLYIIRGEETLRDGIDVHPQEALRLRQRHRQALQDRSGKRVGLSGVLRRVPGGI